MLRAIAERSGNEDQAMFKQVFLLSVISALGVAPTDAPTPGNQPSQPKSDLRAALSTVVPNSEFDSDSVKDAVSFIGDRFNVPIVIDVKAFQSVGVQDIDGATVRLGRVSQLRLDALLRLLLSQVQADFRHQDGLIVVVPIEFTAPERLLRRPVDANFNGVTLGDACKQLTDSTGVSIVVDARCGEEAKRAVTAVLNQTPLDTAVRLLADMADLKSVVIDNALYVTSKANGAVLQQEQEQAGPRPTYPLFGALRSATMSAEPAKPAKAPSAAGEAPSK